MRKIKAHYIFDGTQLHKYATLVLTDSNQVEAIIPQTNQNIEEAGVEFYSGILCPGFINTHCHIELSHLLGKIPMHVDLPNFIEHVISKRYMIELISESIVAADAMMQKNGIVAVGDISNNDISFSIKEQSPILYHTFIELFDSFEEQSTIFNTGKQLFKEYYQHHQISLSPHAPYSCSKTLLHRIAEHALEYNYPISIHNQEHASENELYQSKSGALYDFFSSKGCSFSNIKPSNKTSLQILSPIFEQSKHILFVHNIWTKQQDIDFIKHMRSHDTFTFCLCPLSNTYISNILPPIELFLQNNIPCAIGTDSLASNTKLCILSELYCIQQSFPHIALEHLLRMATLHGAKALGIQNTVGSFTKGTTPGVILLENLDIQNLKIQEQSSVRVLA